MNKNTTMPSSQRLLLVATPIAVALAALAVTVAVHAADKPAASAAPKPALTKEPMPPSRWPRSKYWSASFRCPWSKSASGWPK